MGSKCRWYVNARLAEGIDLLNTFQLLLVSDQIPLLISPYVLQAVQIARTLIAGLRQGSNQLLSMHLSFLEHDRKLYL